MWNWDIITLLVLEKIFGSAIPPVLDFDLQLLDEMAGRIIYRGKAVLGVQPKLSLQLKRQNKGFSRLAVIGIHGDYILKPPSSRYPELPENEDLTMHLAGMVNIITAQHSLVPLASGDLVYITKRFDRQNETKLAVEDFCQLSENLTEYKYRGSIEKIGKLVHKFTTNKGYETQRLFELIIFCYLTCNADMHLKKFH